MRSVPDYVAEDRRNNYTTMFKNIGKLVRDVDKEILGKLVRSPTASSSAHNSRCLCFCLLFFFGRPGASFDFLEFQSPKQPLELWLPQIFCCMIKLLIGSSLITRKWSSDQVLRAWTNNCFCHFSSLLRISPFDFASMCSNNHTNYFSSKSRVPEGDESKSDQPSPRVSEPDEPSIFNPPNPRYIF